MRLTAAAPVAWPTRAQLDSWWRGELSSLDSTSVDPQGYVIDPESSSDVDRVRLVRGTHLAPGASYALESAALDGVEATGDVVGEAGRRVLHLRVRGQRRALGLGSASVIEVQVDGLDAFAGLEATSTNPYVKGSARLGPDPQDPAQARVRLRWLALDLQAEVRSRADGAGDELAAELRLGARGAWSPAVAPVLAVIGRLAGSAMESFVQEWAETLTAVAEDRAPQSRARREEWAQQDRERRRHERSALWVRTEAVRRFHEVQRRIEQEGWWGQRGAAWRRAYAEIPALRWPGRSEIQRPWAEAVEDAAHQLSRMSRRSRRDGIEPVADGLVLPELQGRRELAADPAHAEVALRAEDLELRWLRSPLAAWRHLRRLDQVSAAEAQAMPADAEDPPYDDAPTGRG